MLGIFQELSETTSTTNKKHNTSEIIDIIVASIAHELRTPLCGISLGGQGLQQILPDLFAAYRAACDAKLIANVLFQHGNLLLLTKSSKTLSTKYKSLT